MPHGVRQPFVYADHQRPIKWAYRPKPHMKVQFGRGGFIEPKPVSPTRMFWLGYVLACVCMLLPMLAVMVRNGG